MRLSLQLTLAAFVLTFTCSAPAQQGTIINATYGAGNRQINVTRRVQSMVQQNGWLNFQNTPQALGVSDPAVGRRKTLNITVRQWNGQTRNYEFQDFAQVNLQLGGGKPTNSVVSARYGYGNARVDVTSRVQSMVQPNGTLNFRVSNETLGVRDPAPGDGKTCASEPRKGMAGLTNIRFRKSRGWPSTLALEIERPSAHKWAAKSNMGTIAYF